MEAFNTAVLEASGVEGEMHTHTDPCQRAWCRRCPLPDCPVRQAPQEEHAPITVAQALEAGSI